MWGLVAGLGETTIPSLFHDSPIETSDYLTNGTIHLPCRECFCIRDWFREYQRLHCHIEDSSAGIMGPAAPSLTPGFFYIHLNCGDVTQREFYPRNCRLCKEEETWGLELAVRTSNS